MQAQLKGLLTAVLVFVPPALLAAKPVPKLTVEQLRLERLVTAVGHFKEDVVKDAEKAFLLFGTDAVKTKKEVIEGGIAAALPPRATWAFLIGYAFYIPVQAKTAKPGVAFYNPWCDALVLTHWRHDRDYCRLSDLAVVSAELVRNPKRKAPGIKPGWMRQGADNLPFALGKTSAETVRAVETCFAGEKQKELADAVPALKQPAKARHAAVALQIAAAIRRAEALRRVDVEKTPMLFITAHHLRATMTKLTSGKTKEVLKQADKTLPAVAKVLGKLPGKWFQQLQLAAVTETGAGSQVFLTAINGPPVILVISIVVRDGRSYPARLDLVDLQMFCQSEEKR